MNATAPVSVIVPTFNRAGYLNQCLDAIMAQSMAPKQIIVVDDGSVDSTQEVLVRYASSITNLYQENAGKPAALNFARNVIEQEYVWFFDDDDVALADSIEMRLRALQSDPTLDFVYTGHYLGADGPEGQIVAGERYTPACPASDGLLAQLMIGCYFTLQSVMLKRDALWRVGVFDESLAAGEDYDFMLRLAMIAKGKGLAAPSFIFRQHSGARGSKTFAYAAVERQRVFRKFDQIIGRKLRAATTLGDFVVPRRVLDGDSVDEARATAARMVVMASKALLPELFDDLESLLKYYPVLERAEKRHLAKQCDLAMRTGYVVDVLETESHTVLERARKLKTVMGGRKALLFMALGLLRLAKSYPASLRKRAMRIRLSARLALVACTP